MKIRKQKSESRIRLANEGEPIGLVGLENEFAVGAEGWLQLAPYGDFPHRLGLQRVDPAAAQAMVAGFNSIWGRLKRFFTGTPLYVGHPDLPGMGNEYPDATVYGVFTELAARADGLYGRVALTPAGARLIEGRRYRSVSPHWLAEEIGAEQGHKLLRPIRLQSVGLTNRPNLPVKELGNEGEPDRLPPNSPQSDSLTPNRLQPNAATDEQIHAAITQLKAQISDLQSAQAALANERDTLQAEKLQFKAQAALERQARIDLLLDHALSTGRITPAERPGWAAALGNEADFAMKAVELGARAGKVKTTSVTGNLGERKLALANAQERLAVVQDLIQAKRTQGMDYDAAFVAVQRENPALFEAMKGQGARS